MKPNTAVLLALQGAGLAQAVSYPGLPWTICANSSATCLQNNVTFAYLYSYPFWPYGELVQGDNATTNTLYHNRNLSTAANRAVVKPNVDTLYSRAYMDLSSSDLVITIPEMNDRYWTWPFYDAYSNDVVNIGVLESYPAGDYLVRYNANNPGAWKTNGTGPYQGYINVPTPYSITVVRILVQPDNGGVEAVNALQDQLNITTVPHTYANASTDIPPLNLSIFTDPTIVPGAVNTLEEGVLKLGALLTRYNPSEVASDRSWINETLVSAGFLPNGTFVQPEGTNLTAASAAANASVEIEEANVGFEVGLGANWTLQNTSYQGNFHDAYYARYEIAAGGYLALSSDQVLYPNYNGSSTIANGSALLLTFESKPALAELGFWSLTVYDANGYLIDNPINVYSVGDRSNLTMEDGTEYSGADADAGFQVLVQQADLTPPTNWTSNWLPGPSGGGKFSMNLRFYAPDEVLTNGSWVYPTVQKVDALVG